MTRRQVTPLPVVAVRGTPPAAAGEPCPCTDPVDVPLGAVHAPGSTLAMANGNDDHGTEPE